MRIAKLRQRQRQKKYSDNVNKQRVTRQASERYKFHKPTKYDEFYWYIGSNIWMKIMKVSELPKKYGLNHFQILNSCIETSMIWCIKLLTISYVHTVGSLDMTLMNSAWFQQTIRCWHLWLSIPLLSILIRLQDHSYRSTPYHDRSSGYQRSKYHFNL